MRRFLFEARNNREWIVAIAGLILLALAVGAYILRNEGLSLPWDNTYTITAEFSNAQALTPGQGEPVTVAGVKVGVISSVTLKNGIADVGMSIDRGTLPAVYQNGTALIRPRTGLQDMTISLNPGSPPAPKLGGNVVLPVHADRSRDQRRRGSVAARLRHALVVPDAAVGRRACARGQHRRGAAGGAEGGRADAAHDPGGVARRSRRGGRS